MSRQKQKGTSFETAAAQFFTLATKQKVTRRALTGANDKGDLQGLTAVGEVVVECKNCKKYELAKWLEEAKKETVNAQAEFGVVLFHLNGKGFGTPEKMGEQAVLMDARTFAYLINTIRGLNGNSLRSN